MKKNILTLLLIGTTFVTFGQVKKKTPVKITEIQQVKNDAQRWFKDVYVERNFKDPYSYKVLKCEIIPVTNEESLKDIVDTYKSRVISLDTTQWRSGYQKKKRIYLDMIGLTKTHGDIYKQGDVDLKKKDWDDEVLKYNQAVNEQKEAQSILSETDPVTSKKISHYLVFIDCHSNNSYGNPVLGKYSLEYDTKGLVREPIQLNKQD